ncbi:hypothetical protein NDU88_004409 [Pleurodeles waltl]|uniref:Uncharacterized protein n=1 Tax=Pleurodeles waltl TaxID=8319 RepID=A0AAV7TRW3_PLEWA|nr:hypothetical protein NDU88_004409 [Pleurodeles waltl]
MGRTKPDRLEMTGTGTQKKMGPGERGGSPDTLLATMLAEHTQKFNDILNAVQDIKSTLEPKTDALQIDIGHLHEDHKKLKDRVEAIENTVSEMRPTVADAATHINDLQKEAGPNREQAAKERAKAVAEMELRAGPPPSPELREEQQDVDTPVLDKEQMHVILDDGPLVTPQTAEDVL